MGFRRTVIFVSGAGLFALGAAFAMPACSSTTETTVSRDATTDEPKDTSVDTSLEDVHQQTAEECAEECRKAHPTGAAKDDAIDSCWEANCNDPCFGTGATIPDGGYPDAGVGTDGGMCQNEVEFDPPDPTCSACTQAYCCAAWDGCFNDDDCLALNDCYNACPAE